MFVVYAAASGVLPPNFMIAAADAFVPDLVSASDVVMGKVCTLVPHACVISSEKFVRLISTKFNPLVVCMYSISRIEFLLP
jgi:hypothetical protein